MITCKFNSKYGQKHENDVKQGNRVADQKFPVFHVQALQVTRKNTYSKNLVAVAVDQKSMKPAATNPGGLLW